ncbi:uncharacterized protein LOC134215444 [Armigeres subalbatus]|uniref:uncharacterized protein LOC134215444 n=1 Tax=Armigeres subalbatus TaxID=124917 RepID=UPI002ED5D1C6
MREAGQSKDVFKFRHVCSKHFERAAFKNPLIVSLGLQKHAVPTIKTLNPTAVEDNVLDYESQYIELLSSDMTVDTGVVEEQIDYDTTGVEVGRYIGPGNSDRDPDGDSRGDALKYLYLLCFIVD